MTTPYLCPDGTFTDNKGRAFKLVDGRYMHNDTPFTGNLVTFSETTGAYSDMTIVKDGQIFSIAPLRPPNKPIVAAAPAAPGNFEPSTVK